MANNGFCWVKQLQRVKVDNNDVSGIVIQQKGYEVILESDYPFDAHYWNLKSPDEK